MARIPWIRTTLAAIFCAGNLCGCSLWPFAKPVRTSHITPAERVEAIEQLARQAPGQTASQQEQLSRELAQQIQTEADPLVREAIVRAVAQLDTALAGRMVLAAIDDTDPYVRQAACNLLGRRGDATAVAALGNAARSDDDIDVRLAATRALGALRDPSAVPYLSGNLHDSDPALQLAAVESLKLASGEDLGNDVGAWREWVAARGSPAASQAAVAGQPPRAARP